MEDSVNLKDMIEVIAKRKKTILISIVASMLMASAITLATKPLYEGRSVILIRPVSGSSYQFYGIASLMGMNTGGNASGSSSDLFELLKAPGIGKKVESVLKEAFSADTVDMGEMKAKLNGNILEISVLHRDPYMAAYISNVYVQALSYYWNKLNYTEARKKKEYLEKQLPITEASLKAAEDKLKSLTYLVAQSRDLQGGYQKTVDVLRLEREVELHGSVYKMLRSEYESARVEEAKQISPFSDVENAQVPKRPEKPRPLFNLAVGFLFGLFAGTFLVFSSEYFRALYSKK